MTNNSNFAVYYRTATRQLMDAVANPSGERFNAALGLACLASDSAWSYGRACNGDEGDLAARLIDTIMAAAEFNGFTVDAIAADKWAKEWNATNIAEASK